MPNIEVDIPRWMKLVMAFVDRVGFPIMAFMMMWYMSTTSIEKVNTTLSTTVQMLTEWRASTEEFRKTMADKMCVLSDDDKQILASVDKVRDKLR